MRTLTKQSRIKGGRIRAYAGLEQAVEKEVTAASRKFNVTRAFVITVALAHYFSVDVAETIDRSARRKKAA